MAQVETLATAADRLRDLAGRLADSEKFREISATLAAAGAVALDGVWGSSCAIAGAALASHAPGPIVLVCPQPAEIDALVDELALFSTTRCEAFSAWEALPTERVAHDAVFGERLRILKSLLSDDVPGLLVTSIQSLLQPVPDRATLAERTHTLRTGGALEAKKFAAWLVEHGCHHTSAVELPGEFSIRGGIVDIFAPDWLHPVRVELFGDEIESIRQFDYQTQRSLAPLEAVDVTILEPDRENEDHLASYLPEGTWFLLVEPQQLEEEGRKYLTRLDAPAGFFSVQESHRRTLAFPTVTAESLAVGSLDAVCHLQFESVERFSGDFAKVRQELEDAAGTQDVFVICETDGEAHRLGELLAETTPATSGRLHFPLGRLRAGFRLVAHDTMLVSSAQLFHRPEANRPSRRRLGRAIDSFLDLREGDLVVHVVHGVARYRGLKRVDNQTQEHLVLEFHGGTRVFVPATKIDLVQKYVGGPKARPSLSRLGGKTWVRQKQAAEQAVTDLAGDMLDLQAVRASQPGIAFPAETAWQQEFEASFPYTETPDQLTAIAEFKADMIRPRPMDRLICGDVGYGKTEVAMRAAFKAVEAGYQVGVLVPTTVLAEQHYRTFTSRMAEYPFVIEMISRFRTRGQQTEILKRLADGRIDILIGTHRLSSADVRFDNLGLLVIDEEQRFGVDVKERLKKLRQTVEVMTLTATPIPRTLHMSLLGLRDISNLVTPPEDRLSVETRVTRFEPSLIRHAVLRELNRGGQIYFVHNRVHDIEVVRRRLAQVVPEASIRIGHGQMREHELEKVMVDFVDHKFDLLLSTTIIESGLDIPNANTIFIDEADHYGLADLHQLRGRVGRYKHRAYCYLLVDPNKSVSPVAAKRLRAIEEFSDIGAGFALAMRDLELRGAGNILGTQQSGHIGAVGYELYCQLLEKAVRQLKKLPPKATVEVEVDLPVVAFFPDRYVPDMRLKIDLYRRLARAAEHKQVTELAEELVDRFGPRPPETETLLSLATLKIDAQLWGVRAIRREDEFAVFTYTSSERIRALKKHTRGRLRIADEHSAYLPLPAELDAADAVLAELKTLLQAR